MQSSCASTAKCLTALLLEATHTIHKATLLALPKNLLQAASSAARAAAEDGCRRLSENEEVEGSLLAKNLGSHACQILSTHQQARSLDFSKPSKHLNRLKQGFTKDL